MKVQDSRTERCLPRAFLPRLLTYSKHENPREFKNALLARVYINTF